MEFILTYLLSFNSKREL